MKSRLHQEKLEMFLVFMPLHGLGIFCYVWAKCGRGCRFNAHPSNFSNIASMKLNICIILTFLYIKGSFKCRGVFRTLTVIMMDLWIFFSENSQMLNSLPFPPKTVIIDVLRGFKYACEVPSGFYFAFTVVLKWSCAEQSLFRIKSLFKLQLK